MVTVGDFPVAIKDGTGKSQMIFPLKTSSKSGVSNAKELKSARESPWFSS